MDLERVIKIRWIISETNKGKKYVTGKVKGQFIRLHRFITGETNPEIIIDHINSNGLDNRRKNLRQATSQQNSFNRVVSSRSSTGIKGVFFDKERNKYVARIQVDGKYRNLGRFDTIEKAADKYAEAAKLHYGEYAKASSLEDTINKQ